MPLSLAFLKDSAAAQRVEVRTVNDCATNAATLDRINARAAIEKQAALDEDRDEPSVIPKTYRLITAPFPLSSNAIARCNHCRLQSEHFEGDVNSFCHGMFEPSPQKTKSHIVAQ